jgi:hypothetical protein
MLLMRLVVRHDASELRAGFTPWAAVTHRVDVRRYAQQKQAALAAHHTPATGSGRAARLMRVLATMPVPLFGLALGREWFAEPGAPAGARSVDVLQPAGV